MAEEQRRVENRLLNIRSKNNQKPKEQKQSSKVEKPDPNTSYQDNEDILLKLQQIQQVLLKKQQKLNKK